MRTLSFILADQDFKKLPYVKEHGFGVTKVLYLEAQTVGPAAPTPAVFSSLTAQWDQGEQIVCHFWESPDLHSWTMME